MTDGGWRRPRLQVLPKLRGRLLLRDDGRAERLRGARPATGVRPLAIGRLPNGFVVASETCALDIVGAALVRDVEPGELIRFDDRGLHSVRFAESPRRRCASSSPSTSRGRTHGSTGASVHEARREMGRILAREAPGRRRHGDRRARHRAQRRRRATARSPASRTATASYKNHYVGAPSSSRRQTLRDRGVKLKLNPLPDAIRGKRLVVVDDSIVRGTTTRQIVAALREAGATEVHLRITCPPIKWPCFYGIDMPTRQELIGADLHRGGDPAPTSAPTRWATSRSRAWSTPPGAAKDRFCRACFDGEYPIPIPDAGRQVRAGGPAPAAARDRGPVSEAYRRAGVDIEAAAKAVALIGDLAARARRPEVADGVGGFAGLFRIGGRPPVGRGHRRGGHEARDRSDGRSSGHRGHRPGGDVRRRRRVHGRRTALLPGLPRGGPGGARTGRRRSWKASPRDADARAARCWAARPPSIPA